MPIPDKAQAIKDMAIKTNKKQVRSFIGIINYYRAMWKYRSDILISLTKMTCKQATWNWTNECQKIFEQMMKQFLEKLY